MSSPPKFIRMVSIVPARVQKGSRVTREWNYDLFIDGNWSNETELPKIDVIDPATEELIGRVPEATPKTAVRAITAARTAFDDGPWPWMKPAERAAVLVRMAEIMESRTNELRELMMAETGCAGPMLDGIQAHGSIAMFRSNAEQIQNSLQWVEPIGYPKGSSAGVAGHALFREPIGVVAIITPFNFPFMLNVVKLAPALATGCTAVLKPHSWTPLDALFIAQVAEEAGLPPGVLNVITGNGEVGDELTSNPMVDMITFTGSTATGRRVMESAAPTVKRVQLELGGKSAQVVLGDVGEDYVRQIGFGDALIHCGQGCSLNTRLLMPEHLLSAYLAGVREAASNVRIGDPRDPETNLGPLIREQQRTRVEALVQSGLEEGAELIAGGQRPKGRDAGFFYEPTVLVGHNDMRVAQEEIFGPVLTVIPYSGEDEEAVRLANDSIYGLGGGVVAANTGRAFNVARKIRTGMISAVGVGNGSARPDSGQGPGWASSPASAPGIEGAFGGFKQSGLGREWGHHGLEEFTEVKSLLWQ
jgi:aldehyde dehydrogenase (NAD+)